MSDSRVIWYTPRKLKDPLAVIGFPSVGLVSSIVTSFIARELRMTMAAGITAPELPPYALIQGGTPYPQIRVYVTRPNRKTAAAPAAAEPIPAEGTEVASAPAKTAKKSKAPLPILGRDLVIVTSEVAPKPEQTYEIVQNLIEVLKKLGVRETVCLEGIPKFNEETAMLAVATTPAMRKLAAKTLGVRPMDEGLVRGATGVMLYEGAAAKSDVLALLCPASPQFPDPRAASALLEPLSKLVPGLKLDTTPLFKEAEEIDQRIKSEQQQENTSAQQIYG